MSAKITLEVIHGNGGPRVHVFDGPARCLVGRAPVCDIQLLMNGVEGGVSRHHCLIEIEPPRVSVRDLGSLNGTFVNGDLIGRRPGGQTPEDTDTGRLPAHPLSDGDEIRVGGAVLRVGVTADDENLEPVYLPWNFM